MRRLWAPWRLDYIKKEREVGCLFCRMALEKNDAGNLFLCRGRLAFAVLNRFPYGSGHLMVVPKRHCTEIEMLTEAEFREMGRLVKQSVSAVKRSLGPEGFNIGINLGTAGGAGMDHLHIHVVPRWVGDTNFMPILGEAKVMPAYLEESLAQIRAAWEAPRKKGTGRRDSGEVD
jgi:ATP adenylyltransferase